MRTRSMPNFTCSSSSSWVGLWVALALTACGAAPTPSVPPSGPAEAPTLLPADADRGRLVYRKACAACHGAVGDGDGPGAPGLDPLPRDFTRGVYRYRSTPTGSLPRAEDLIRTVRTGAPGTSMPAWAAYLSGQEIVDVVATVRRFSPRFNEEEILEPVAMPEPIPFSAESVARGRTLYEKARCARCHGEKGTGDGWAKNDELRDNEGRVVHPRDFTDGIYRAGSQREALYRVIHTGLDGTPMPSYAGAFPDRELYDLVNYLLALESSRGLWFWLSTPPRWFEPFEQRAPR